MNPLKALKLSRSEHKVWHALLDGHRTPLDISRHTKLARQTVYDVLQSLRGRGLAKRSITAGKSHWKTASDRDIETNLYNLKKSLLRIQDGVEETYGLGGSKVIIHQGPQAIRNMFFKVIESASSHSHVTLQGDPTRNGWEQIFDIPTTDKINQIIKEKNIIIDVLVNEHWYQKQVEKFGFEWIKEIEGRSAITRMISPQYLDHGGQMWFAKDAVYLASMSEELVVEIRDSHIQKMVMQLFHAIQDRAKIIDVNTIVRNLKKQYHHTTN